jgi:protoheme IX farnesyltransferase
MAILIPLTLLPVTFGAFGMIYLASATVLGLVMLWSIVRTVRATAWTQPAWWSYRFSLLYLALLFAAMVVDRRAGL